MAQNITTFILLNVPLENDYKHTLYFNNKTEQANYFRSRMVRTFELSSYQKKDEPIHCPTTDANGLDSEYDDLINAGVNYVMYKNSAYTDKWFYAFIKEIEYISDGQVDIHIETDCIQTWLFDYRIKASFIEREHVSDDTIGKHTVPEGLETGEYISVGNGHVDFGEMYIVVATTQDYATKVKGGVYGGCFSGVKYLYWKLSKYEDARDFIYTMAKDYSAADAITAVFMAPEFIVKGYADSEDGEVDGSFQANAKLWSTSKHQGMLGSTYTPVNRKLLCYPYNYMLVSNNNGASAIYQYEHFQTITKPNECDFKIYGTICPGGSIKMVPLNYKGMVENLDESINAGKFPICNWNTDVYINWLTQNSINVAGLNINADQLNLGGSMMSSILQVAGGVGMMATGGGALAGAGMIANGMAGGVSGISGAVMQMKQHQMTPPQAEGNINCGDVLTAMGSNKISVHLMTIKGEYAQIIDEYFHMFGYKVNRVKVPNKCHRSRFWFTKTIDINIDGAIPNNDIQIIKNAYNKGITFWRNASEIQDYSLTNEIALTEGSITD